LSSFDSYLLAANCAQFPLPVITGIGHERDDTVLDMVAHTRMKTPTAVAEFLIAQMDRAAEELKALQQAISLSATDRLAKQQALLQLLGSRLPVLALNQIERNRMLLQRIGNQFPIVATTLLSKKRNRLDTLSVHFKNQVEGVLMEQRRWIELTEQFVKMASPDYLLKRGYSLTLRNGKIVKQAEELEQGDEMTVRFADGEVQVQVLFTNRE
jgi:exodeoxyribonuclease VII large subunit